MELLEFREKILKLCNVDTVEKIGNVLMSAILSNDIEFFAKYENITDNTKDWLQALWQYYEADRTDKKQDFTPKSIGELVALLAGNADSVYDCCGGSGALTKAFIKNNNPKFVYVEELDEKVIPFLLFNLCLSNISGYVTNGDVLSKKYNKCYHLISGEKYSLCQETECVYAEEIADISISNPPFNIKWNPPLPLDGDMRFPIIPPAGNANYAFIFNCLSRAKQKAILILPNGVTSENTEYDCRKYLVDNDLLETVIILPDKMFEVTGISTCVYVLNKNKKHKGEICFIDSRKNCIVEERDQKGQFGSASHTNRIYKKTFNVLSRENIKKILDIIEGRQNLPEFSAIVKNEDVFKNEYLLTPSRYIEFCEKVQPHRDFKEIADNINYICRMQNACKLVINETIAKGLGLDIETFKRGKEQSKQLQEQMKRLGLTIEIEDYIQFTKNKNEFIFKCNDKDLLPDILIQFFSIWKNQIALLNTMQNQYLSELRDAMLPDLMSGKIEL